MRDYALLAKSFRHCAEKRECASCPMYVKDKKCPDFEVRKLAADAIEELLAKVPKQGEWLPHQNAQFIEVDVCSACGIGTRKMYHCTDGIQTWDEKPFFRYCPWCGAKLSEPPKGVE